MKLTLTIDATQMTPEDVLPLPDIVLTLNCYEFVTIKAMIDAHLNTEIFEQEQSVIDDLNEAYELYRKYLTAASGKEEI